MTGEEVAIAVSCRGLTKRYGHTVALDRLDLEVPAGSIFGFLGPNGAGKTTTLRLLTGLARPSSGYAEIAGVRVGTDRAALASRIGYLDQDPRYYGWMSGRELLRFVGRLYGLTGTRLEERVGEVLALVGLSDAANTRIGAYSGGMRQRIGVGQAIIGRPQVLFLDEPVSALDPEGRRDVLEIIAQLRDTATVFMSTHILNDVERVCDRVGILDRGRLVSSGPIEQLLEAYDQPLYRLVADEGQGEAFQRLGRRLSDEPWVASIEVDDGPPKALKVHVGDARTAAREILGLVAGCGVSLESFERARPTLEDVFLRVVSGDRSGIDAKRLSTLEPAEAAA